jgi:peptide chain release factor 3
MCRSRRAGSAPTRPSTALASAEAREFLGERYAEFLEEVELVRGASPAFDLRALPRGRQTPVFFGSAVNNFGVRELLSAFVRHSPGPQPRRHCSAREPPRSRSSPASCSRSRRTWTPGIATASRSCASAPAATRAACAAPRAPRQGGPRCRCADLLAADRSQAEEAYAGDIIGLHNHGTINIGDTFTEGEQLTFTGRAELRAGTVPARVLKDPLRMKALQKGLSQLCEEGATQLFKPLRNNDLILGAIGQLQFEVVAFRLQDEYSVQCVFEPINVALARWVRSWGREAAGEFRDKAYDNLALDHGGELVYLAPTRVNLGLTEERWPQIEFRKTRENLTPAMHRGDRGPCQAT